jgi:hypothetical protein
MGVGDDEGDGGEDDDANEDDGGNVDANEDDGEDVDANENHWLDSCVRYSRVPSLATGRPGGQMTNTDAPVVFQSREFGEPGCGVLHPATSTAVQQGAEDGGEMGAYHEEAFALRRNAMLDKLADFLPVGLEAVVVPDTRLYENPHAVLGEAPPEVSDEAES